MKKILTALLLAAAMAVSVSASDAPKANGTEEIAVAPLSIEGYELINVTSSNSSIPGTYESVSTSLLFDGLADTGCTIEFLELSEKDAAESDLPKASEKTLSVYTSSGVPHRLRALSLLLDGEMGTVLNINVYGTNDSLLLDWTQLNFTSKTGEKQDGYHVFNIAGETEKYVFYRIDIHVQTGSSFTVNEIGLYKSIDIYDYYYNIDGDIIPGETPEIIRVLREKPEELKEVPKFGLGRLPGAFRPVPYR